MLIFLEDEKMKKCIRIAVCMLVPLMLVGVGNAAIVQDGLIIHLDADTH